MPDRLYQHETTEAGGQVQHKRKRLPGYLMGGQLSFCITPWAALSSSVHIMACCGGTIA